MWRRRRPKRGDRRVVPFDRSGRREGSVTDRVWALEEHDGQLWQLQGLSVDVADAARFRIRR